MNASYENAVALLMAIVVAIGTGCARRQEPAAPEVVNAPPAAAPPAQPANVPAQEAYQPVPRAELPSADTNPGQAQSPDEAEEQKKPRDFSAELAGMLAGASTCLQARPPGSAGAITVSVTAHVMPSGSVSRGEVDAAQLQEDERGCLRGRIESQSFALPIENAPFSVRSSLQLTPKSTANARQAAPRTDSLGMVVTQAPSGAGVSPGVVPPPDPGVVPPPDPGVPLQADPGVVPPPDPPAEVLPFPSAVH